MNNIPTVLKHIERIHEAYSQDSLDPFKRPIEIDDLVTATETYYSDRNLQISINAAKSDPLNGRILGMYLRQGNEVQIVHAQEGDWPNHCFKRVIIAKEMIHIPLDNEDSFTNKAGDLLEQIALHLRQYVPKQDPLSRQKNADELASFLGVLLLIPFNEIIESKAQVDAENNGIGYPEIAERYKVPLAFVEHLLSESILDFLRDQKKLSDKINLD